MNSAKKRQGENHLAWNVMVQWYSNSTLNLSWYSLHTIEYMISISHVRLQMEELRVLSKFQ